MDVRKTVHGNQDKNIVILEKIYLLGRCILVRKATGNKTFQPLHFRLRIFNLTKISSRFCHLREVKNTCTRKKRIWTGRIFREVRDRFGNTVLWGLITSPMSSRVEWDGSARPAPQGSSWECCRVSTLPSHVPLATLFISLVLRQILVVIFLVTSNTSA